MTLVRSAEFWLQVYCFDPQLLHCVSDSLDRTVYTYVTDTGICDNALSLAKNADLFILEYSHLSNETNKGWPHINPQEAAQVALKSGAKKLALTHFDSNKYKTIETRVESFKIVKSKFPNAILANDMLSLDL